ncbi:MAG: hypothetical protein J0H01_19455 [Rhizobiales bacterium]|nr:hypothetical protein [Hyphomicrobiales bacterium]
MSAAMDTRFVRSAAGAFALCVALAWPVSGAQAAQRAEPIAGATADTSQVEMQRRHAGPRAGIRHGGYRHGGYRHGGHRGRGYYGGNGALIGAGAAALILGGAAAAAASQRECWIEPRWVDGPYGPERRRVRVCE